jgi:hypothetical protein
MVNVPLEIRNRNIWISNNKTLFAIIILPSYFIAVIKPNNTLIKKKIKFSYIYVHIWGNAQIFPHIWGGRQSYMTLQLLRSEFPYIRGKFSFLFYECRCTVLYMGLILNFALVLLTFCIFLCSRVQYIRYCMHIFCLGGGRVVGGGNLVLPYTAHTHTAWLVFRLSVGTAWQKVLPSPSPSPFPPPLIVQSQRSSKKETLVKKMPALAAVGGLQGGVYALFVEGWVGGLGKLSLDEWYRSSSFTSRKNHPLLFTLSFFALTVKIE